jgi:hypothetical protein
LACDKIDKHSTSQSTIRVGTDKHGASCYIRRKVTPCHSDVNRRTQHHIGHLTISSDTSLPSRSFRLDRLLTCEQFENWATMSELWIDRATDLAGDQLNHGSKTSGIIMGRDNFDLASFVEHDHLTWAYG